MRFEAQIIRLSDPFFDSLDSSFAPFPASDSFARMTFGSPFGGPVGAVGLDAGLLSAWPLGFDCAVEPSTAGAAPASALSSDGRNAFASSIPPGRPGCSGPLWISGSYWSNSGLSDAWAPRSAGRFWLVT